MDIARQWRLRRQRYRLEGTLCPDCGQVAFAPRPACPTDSALLMGLRNWNASDVTPAAVVPNVETPLRLRAQERAVR